MLLKKVKVNCTLVQALRLCTGRRAHGGSRGIALLFHDHGIRRGWVVSVTPWPLFTPGKDPVPMVQEAVWAPGPVWTGAENLAPTGIRSRTFQPVASRYTDYASRPTDVTKRSWNPWKTVLEIPKKGMQSWSDLISYLKGRLHRIYMVWATSAVRGLHVGNMKFNTRIDEFNVHGSVHRNNILVYNSN